MNDKIPDNNSQIFSRNEWVAASKTRNYALNDTLIDWLNIWYDKVHNPQKTKKNEAISIRTCTKENNTFTSFLMNTGLNFEKHVIELIKQKISENEFVTICETMDNYDVAITDYEKKSIAEMMKGTPVIYQPVLMNYQGDLAKTYGLPDLLVRSDYLGKIIQTNPLENSQFFHAPKLSGKYHYVVVDIKFSTLELCSDGQRIRNNGSIPAYKCQLYIYNNALGCLLVDIIFIKLDNFNVKLINFTLIFIFTHTINLRSKNIHYL